MPVGNRFRRRYRFPRESVPAWIPNPKGISVPAWILNPKGISVPADISFSVDTESHRKSVLKLNTVFQKISSGVNTDIPGNQFQRGYRFPGNRLQRGRRYSKEFGSNVNADILRKSAPTWILFPRNSVLVWILIIFQEIGSSVNTDIPGKVFFGFSLNRWFSGSLWIRLLLGQ
ncbi:unnamed protein product [Rhizophagus irregularis]|nr:unnamed protein product [Rhizophagus irregularis]